jgi:hypothetical protein
VMRRSDGVLHIECMVSPAVWMLQPLLAPRDLSIGRH